MSRRSIYNMTFGRVSLRKVIAALLLNAAATASVFALPAGSRVDNEATAVFTDSHTTQTITRISNRVSATVESLDKPNITLALAAAKTQIVRNQTVPLQLTISNTGSTASGMEITADGITMTQVLVGLAIPAGTVFTSATTPANAKLLFHRINTAALVFTAIQPSDVKEIDQIIYAFNDFANGESAHGVLTVTATNDIGHQVWAIANIWYDESVGSSGPHNGTASDGQSNAVSVPVNMYAAKIRYYTNNQFSTEAAITSLGTPLYVQVDAPGCNIDSTVIDKLNVTIQSNTYGDSRTFTAFETSVGSGEFRIDSTVKTTSIQDSQNKKNASASPDDSENIETHHNDTLTASISGCETGGAWSTILVDPYGVVFDSISNEPVAGAIVELIDVDGRGNGGDAGGPALVYLADGVTQISNIAQTGVDGAYHFPLIPESTYRLKVTPPVGYKFASKITPASLPANRIIDAAASYGNNFSVSAAWGVMHIDVPVDAAAVDGLFVEKTASRSTAEIGDFVDYTVQIKNSAGVAFSGLTWQDTLPTGFKYQSGSFRRDGVQAEDPSSKGPVLTLNIGALADGGTVKLRYRVKLGPGAQLGDGINRAVAISSSPRARSNIAEAKVKVEGGVFSDRGFVLGKIFADCDGDKIQSEGEPGVAGVRVWLEDGTYAISDGLGKFSFYGLSPRTHVAKIDSASAPAGATFEVLDQRNAGVGTSRFIDLKNGELARADFAISNCDADMRATLAQRSEEMQKRGGEIEAGITSPLTLDANANARSSDFKNNVDLKGKAASGVIVNDNKNPQALSTAIATVEAAILAQRPLAEIADSIGAQGNTLDFVGLIDGAAVGSAQIRVLVKGLLGAELAIVVNGNRVADSQLGTRVTRAETQLELFEFIGVELQPGDNMLTAEQRDSFGNLRASKTIRVRAPGELHNIRLERARVSGDEKNTDNKNDSAVAVYLEDSNGVPVTSRTPLTLETDRGEWAVADLNPSEAGVQVFVEGGHAQYTLHAPEQDGAATVKISSGNINAETRVDFLPAMRDMLAVGVIEGTLKLGKLGSGSLVPARKQDGFEQELKQFSYDSGHAAARAAVFLKGKIKGDYLLTLGYDSDKETQERLFRDIQPDQFYPVYGDASIKGYDAQSTQKLYVRVDKNKSWVLYGDFTTPGATPERSLTAYNRSLTGVRQHYENERVAVNTFASHDSTRQIIEEIRANGTSGPYLLSNNDLIENSEQIEIITRDRNQPAIIIKSVPMTRFADYELEPFSGRVLFRAPIASVDADLNPNSIRITYEVDSGGENFWVGGADAQVKITENISVGVVDIEDRDPADTASLRGANMTMKFGETVVITEAARSDKFSVGEGEAQRVEIKHDNETWQTRVFAGRSDEDFYNPSATLSKGRSEAGAKISRKIDDNTRMLLDALHSGDIASGATRDGALLGAEHAFDDNIKLELGVRHTHEVAGDLSATNFSTSNYTTANIADPIDLDAPGSVTDTTSLRAKLGAPVPGISAASMYGELEQAIDDSDKKLAAVGGEYRMQDKGRIYGRHEFISSLSGPYAFDSNQRRDTTVFGIDRQYAQDGEVMKDGRAYSEYRSHDAFSGREAEAAMGLKNQWAVADGIRLNTSAERVRSLNGDEDQGESIALAGGVEYTRNPNLKGTARLEWRTAPGSTGILSTLGVARKINEEWTFLGRNIYNSVDNDSSGTGAGDRLQDRLQLGFAYRDAETNVWNGLGRYEFKHEQDDTASTGYWHQAHVMSLQANVKPQQAVVLSTRYAGKYAVDQSDGIDSRGVTHLIGSRVTWDFAKRWDASVQASTLFSSGSHEKGLGAEIGYQVQDNLWVSAGYNVFGFHDRDLSGEDNTERGAYFRLRFKFDENSFEGFK